MPVEGVYRNISSILQRIEEIKRRFGVPSARYRSFAQHLQEAESRSAVQLDGTGQEKASPEEATAAHLPDRTGNSFFDRGVHPSSSLQQNAGTDTTGEERSYDGIIQQAAQRYRIPEALIRAVIKQESGFDRSAISPKGAMGLMQLMPETAALLGVQNPFDPGQNIFGGTRYLRELLELYGGNMNRALAAYNAGPHKVVQEVPGIPETKDFVDAVLKHFRQYSGMRRD